MKDEAAVHDRLGSTRREEEQARTKTRLSSFIPHPSSFLKWLVRISRFGLAALFLFTAGAKLAILKEFSVSVAQLLGSASINFHRWQWPVTIAVICVEVLTAGLLLLPRTVRLGAVMCALLLVGFSGFALYYVYVLHGEALECGCFGGIIASQLGVKTALRNLGLLVPALIVFFGWRRRSQHERDLFPSRNGEAGDRALQS